MFSTLFNNPATAPSDPLPTQAERYTGPTVAQDPARPDLGGNFVGGDTNCFTPVLWRYLVDRFGIRSVLDVGCGEGFAVGYFQRLGVSAHGIDGLPANVDRAVAQVALHDLTTGPYRMRADLVVCIEVAEHIEERFVANLIDTLANGRVICMTAAGPGQDGHHHVNCQPSEYWVEKLASKGYRLSHENDHFRQIAAGEPGFKYFAATGLVFLRY